MKKVYLQIVLCFLVVTSATSLASAQTMFGFNYNISNPTGDYAENVQLPMGISINLLVANPKLKGLHYGIETGVSMYAGDSYDYDFNGKTIELSEEDCYLSYQGVARYHFRMNKLVKPYVEGRIGGISYFSTLMADDQNFKDDSRFYGTSFTYGFGGGVAISLCEQMSLDLGVTRAHGLDTNYRSVTKTDPVALKSDLNAGIKSSRTDFLNFKIGVLFGF